MEAKYEQWITDNVRDMYGKCADITKRMALVFPELTRVRGHYYCHLWGERDHWWLVAPDGSVVDPTARQFPSNGTGGYVEWDESRNEPTGLCPNCGGYCYDGMSTCSDECSASYVSYLKNGKEAD